MYADKYLNKKSRGNLIVISGPSGVGKGSIRQALLERCSEIAYSVSATTRSPRNGERNGKEYFFHNNEEFEHMISDDMFLEWAKVYENYYGTPSGFVERTISAGFDCILEIDVQGAMQVKMKKPEGIFIFIAPPSKEELVNRIKGRGTENDHEIIKRMNNVDAEMAVIKSYNYVVVNKSLADAVELIYCIIMAERARIK